MSTKKEMPKYQSHKEIWALKIKEIVFDHDLAKADNRETDGSAIITPKEEGYAPFKVDRAYCIKHEPKVGGYYVVYEGGYKSFSPADAFEGGYTLIQDNGDRNETTDSKQVTAESEHGFLERLIEEKNSLEDKIEKLSSFLTKQFFVSDTASAISKNQIGLLTIQYGIMVSYLNVLEIRIKHI